MDVVLVWIDEVSKLKIKSKYFYSISALLVFLQFGCVTTDSQNPKTIDQSREEDDSQTSSATPELGQQEAVETASPSETNRPLPPDLCTAFSSPDFKIPFFAKQGPAVVTKMLNDCVTRLGERGYTKDLAWIAMGFPCTAGSGKISIKGNYYAPKMISFMVTTDCPMASSTGDFPKVVQNVLGIPAGAPMLALNPFAVQYWEIPSSGDADTGFAVELRTSLGVGQIWKQLRGDESLAVRLYGRENAWVQGNVIYEVDAEIKLVDRLAFQLNILSVKKLTLKEMDLVKERCGRHVSKSACQSVL